jgi:hypothetical protein
MLKYARLTWVRRQCTFRLSRRTSPAWQGRTPGCWTLRGGGISWSDSKPNQSYLPTWIKIFVLTPEEAWSFLRHFERISLQGAPQVTVNYRSDWSANEKTKTSAGILEPSMGWGLGIELSNRPANFWRAGTTQPYSYSVPYPHRLF